MGQIRPFVARDRRQNECHSADQGFAAVDAMVALVILSTTIILSLGAIDIGRKAAIKAVEIRKATALLQGLLEITPGRIGSLSGTANGFDWQVVTTPANDNAPTNPIKLCDQTANAVSHASGRRYGLSMTEVCPPETKP